MNGDSFDIRVRSVELVSLAPFYERFRARIEGPSDAEYLWEPVAGCLTVRPRSARPVPDRRNLTTGSGHHDRMADVSHRRSLAPRTQRSLARPRARTTRR